jgi:radical SAM protein with 4Fe4S-binding SPASM domain
LSSSTSSSASSTVQRRLPVVVDDAAFRPVYVVWELTLRCDHACAHCGSRAGGAREDELTTTKALAVVDELAAMGAREVVLIGGEAYLHDGFLDVVRKLKAAGIRPTMTTGGKGITAELAREMKAAGIHAVSVSVDGLAREHNLIRQSARSFEGAMAALDHLKAAGITIAANTNINRVNQPVLEELFDALADKRIAAWQVQITVPLGRAADRPQMLLQPYDLLDVVPRLAALKRRAFARGITMMPGNNLGYFGPEEALLRSPHDVDVDGAPRDHWQGCQAGRMVMGIESDGGVKGCPSLQSSHYVGGTLKEKSLRDLWTTTPELAFNRARGVDDLWGFCRTCPFAAVCKGGCTFTAHALFGRPGNNPYCHFRARTLAARGVRERLVPGEAAAGLPFDNGLFDVVVEPLASPEAEGASLTPATTTDAVDDGVRLVAIGRLPRSKQSATPGP